MENNKFRVELFPSGNISKLIFKNDPSQMNWMIDTDYLNLAGYDATDKLFGSFSLTVQAKTYNSRVIEADVSFSNHVATVTYLFEDIQVRFIYDLSQSADAFYWTIQLKNRTNQALDVSDFTVWAPFAYVMYRINDLPMQTKKSAAVFPSISKDFTKLACVRRSNEAPHLGVYQVKGETKSIGTYCDYENRFFENVSPSLDGLLFHQLVFAGGYPAGFENSDWIYSKDGFSLKANEMKVWKFAFEEFSNLDNFYQTGKSYGHPVYDADPLAIVERPYHFSVSLAPGNSLIDAWVEYKDQYETVNSENIKEKIQKNGSVYAGTLVFTEPGEHKLCVKLSNGKVDCFILNVMEPIQRILADRADYISKVLYQGADSEIPYSYFPVSNQGESLGKLSFVLKKNLLEKTNKTEVEKVEESCVNYIRPKWFVDGDFTKPADLYGDFYRCMDFEYIGHVFYLLSQFDDETLQYNSANTYLEWAADVFCLRVNPDLHETERGKEEAQMLGTYFLYINDLLKDLKERGLHEKYIEMNELWTSVAETVATDSVSYKAAVTEHFYDNAGFGPAAGALASSNRQEAAKRYGELLIANIGFSNDFRAQNPDRWWEALSYMVHSLWGGLTAAGTLKAYEALHDARYLKAAYRATVGILYCYDPNARAIDKRLSKGEAASTYSVAGPHLNRPDLSRNRFGQSTFYRDGGIFAKLFNKEEETSDWDMGEELVAYLDGFGKKTFLYEEDNEIKVINGSIEQTDKGLLIHSYAPYPSEYHFYDADAHFISDRGEIINEILYADGRFIKVNEQERGIQWNH